MSSMSQSHKENGTTLAPALDGGLAVLAHELRAPLGTLLYSLELIRSMGPHSEVFDQSVSVMERQVQYMSRLIGDLLDLSRADRGKLTLTKEYFELERVITAAVETSRQALDERCHQVVL